MLAGKGVEAFGKPDRRGLANSLDRRFQIVSSVPPNDSFLPLLATVKIDPVLISSNILGNGGAVLEG